MILSVDEGKFCVMTSCCALTTDPVCFNFCTLAAREASWLRPGGLICDRWAAVNIHIHILRRRPCLLPRATFKSLIQLRLRQLLSVCSPLRFTQATARSHVRNIHIHPIHPQ